jgi:hypothetical protein
MPQFYASIALANLRLTQNLFRSSANKVQKFFCAQGTLYGTRPVEFTPDSERFTQMSDATISNMRFTKPLNCSVLK